MHVRVSWEGEQAAISVAIWTPPEDWEEEFDLSLGQLTNYVEAKLPVRFVDSHKRLPELNRQVG